MKLKTLILGTALALPLVALADDGMMNNPFAGAYVGAGVGYLNTNIQTTSGIKVNTGAGGIAGQVLAGYNYAFSSSMLMGAQAYFQTNNAKIGAGTTTQSYFKVSQSFGVDATFGYAVNQDNLLFAGVGFTRAKAKDAAAVPESRNGARALVGAQQALGNALSLRESFAYARYKAFSGGTRATQPSYMVSLLYNFNV